MSMKIMGRTRNQTGLLPTPKIESNHKERKTGQQLVGRSEQRPQEKPALACVFDRPRLPEGGAAAIAPARRTAKMVAPCLFLRKANNPSFFRTQSSSDFLNDVPLQTAGGIQSRAGERSDQDAHQGNRHPGGQADRHEKISRTVHEGAHLGPQAFGGAPRSIALRPRSLPYDRFSLRLTPRAEASPASKDDQSRQKSSVSILP